MPWVISDTYTQQAAYLHQHKIKSGGASLCEGAADMGHMPHPATDLVVDFIDRNPSHNLDPRNFRALCRPVAQQRIPSRFLT